ncbi:MAG: hypothetical protein JWQ09_4446 [Segetibacter sp.]|nr:hypothetical protein [Segetibacter sp.]
MNKYLVAIIIGFIFVHHLICTVLCNAPVNPLTSRYQGYVSNYMDPLFTQRWLLFAPEPATSDLKLWYKIKLREDKKWLTWLDPLEPILKKHQRLRFTYNAKLLYIYGNIPRDLSIKNEILNSYFACKSNDSVCSRKRDDSLWKSTEFILAKKYVKRDIEKSFNYTRIDSIQIMVIQLYPKQFSERLTNKPFGYANSIEFNPIAFSDAN